MAEENNGAAQETKPVAMKIVNQYIRDLSFENVAAQKNLGGDLKPEVNVQVNLDAAKKSDNGYEVALKLNVSAKSGEQAVFLLEIDYAGLFQIENIPEEQLHPFLMIECPRMMFPFVRRIARDVTADGGFPPLNIDNIDFMQLYRTELMRRQQAAAEQAPTN
ncbi:protein-export chaperone SecB [Neptunicoccus cionae]|uniref:protein-export chaperone SecB n=1 Tax=Neptunicoccus cionae TaxID=2035344 RepID=UPI000C775FAE|nr:protein-export chaperone SecB [Amylibacter cionae]MBR9862424.1 protein-export chaperone SecB [Paracoccaceae bacterium]PLS22781.1 protein-export chaperone SecB [Amylibacter cionae]